MFKEKKIIEIKENDPIPSRRALNWAQVFEFEYADSSQSARSFFSNIESSLSRPSPGSGVIDEPIAT